MMKTTEYQKSPFDDLFLILPAISRSFSYIILRLKNREIRKIIAVSYILFRIADTIEDSICSNDIKSQLFELLLKMTSGESSFTADDLCAFMALAENLETGSEAEKQLIKRTRTALNGYYLLAKDMRIIIDKWLCEMVKGMKIYLNKSISDFADLEDYCWYVAGTVGFLLSEVFDSYKLLHTPPQDLGTEIRHFALSLQKVNIIRDIHDDSKKGRSFWPECIFNGKKHSASCLSEAEKSRLTGLMIENAVLSVIKGYKYVLNLRRNEPTIRYFCIFSIILALKTLILIKKKPLVFEKNIKVSKSGFYQTLLEAKISTYSNSFYKYSVSRYLKFLSTPKNETI